MLQLFTHFHHIRYVSCCNLGSAPVSVYPRCSDFHIYGGAGGLDELDFEKGWLLRQDRFDDSGKLLAVFFTDEGGYLLPDQVLPGVSKYLQRVPVDVLNFSFVIQNNDQVM